MLGSERTPVISKKYKRIGLFDDTMERLLCSKVDMIFLFFLIHCCFPLVFIPYKGKIVANCRERRMPMVKVNDDKVNDKKL